MRQVCKQFVHCVLLPLFSVFLTVLLFVSAEEGKDEKMDTSSPTEEKRGAHISPHVHTHFAMKVNLKVNSTELEFIRT